MPVPRLPKQDYIGTEPEGIDLKVERKRFSQVLFWRDSFIWYVLTGFVLAYIPLMVLEKLEVVPLKESKYRDLIFIAVLLVGAMGGFVVQWIQKWREEEKSRSIQNEEYIQKLSNQIRESRYMLLSGMDAIREELRNLTWAPIKQPQIADLKTASNTVGESVEAKDENILEFSSTLAFLKEDLLDEIEEARDREKLHNEIDRVERALAQLGKITSAEEARLSPAMKRLSRFMEKFGDPGTRVGRAIRSVENGIGYAEDLAKYYNDVAAWCALPLIPAPFSEKSDEVKVD